ncbi:MAG TPA: hypothetical protein VLN73_00460, partial [Alphaproteobacteria bacterium]|nr:hypothetical protein [Alphaproteobacteria bacterium]
KNASSTSAYPLPRRTQIVKSLTYRLDPVKGGMSAAFMAQEFQPRFDTLDLLNLPNHHTYLKLMIRGAPSQPFSATTLLPSEIL